MSSNEFKIIFEDRDRFLLVEKYVPENQVCVSVDDGGMIVNTTISPADALALADAIYEAEGRGWLPYPENEPDDGDGEYYVTVCDTGGNPITSRDYWTDVGGWYHYNDDDVLAFMQYPSPYQPKDTDD